jgi:quercetin dioxygenase-like cupin family protein
MVAYKSWISLVAVFLCAAAGSHIVADQISAHVLRNKSDKRVCTASSHPQPKPKLAESHLEVKVLKVTYGPGEFSQPHPHPCPVIGYVLEGAVRMQVKGEPETTYLAGDGFYEAPNGIRLVSANASSKEPARFLAYFVCGHETPLSVAAPETAGGQQS